MISNELMMALIKYHVLDIKNNEEINNLIISELEEKTKQDVKARGLHKKVKRHLQRRREEEYRQKYLDTVGMHQDFRW